MLTSNALSSIHSNSGESIVTLSSSPSLASNILHISLCKAITQRDFDEILSLLALGGDANTQCEYNLNYTPLIIAVKASNVQLVEILLRDYDANPNLTDSHYWSPLMFAAIQQSSSSLRILELLIEYHSDPTLRNRDDMTALQLANYLHNDASYHYLSLIPQ